MEFGASPPGPCALQPQDPLEPIPAALCALGTLCGLLCGCFGYRCFRAVLFLSGLLLGTGIIFLLCHKQRVLEAPLSLGASAGLALGIGLLCGLLTLLLRSVGLFATGLLLGLLLAAASLALALPLLPASPWVPVGGLLGLALLCALLALQWPKAVTVLATASLGAATVVVCIDHLLQASALLLFLYQRLRLAPARAPCWHGWVLLGAWPLLGGIAVVLQWKVTAGGIRHREGALSRHQQLRRSGQGWGKRRQSPPEGTHQRKPPPGGGTVAPSHIRSLQDPARTMPGPPGTAHANPLPPSPP